MEDFANLLQRDYGLKPQGKMAPMSATKGSGSSSSRSGGGADSMMKGKSASNGGGSRSGRASTSGDDDLFFVPKPASRSSEPTYDDVFGGPPKFSAPKASASTIPIYDDFRAPPPPPSSSSSAAKENSFPVFDTPYDDDIFMGVRGTRPSNIPYDNVFGGPSSSGSPSDDLLGGYKAKTPSPETSPTYDDELLPGHSSKPAGPSTFISVDDVAPKQAEVDPFGGIHSDPFSNIPPPVEDPLESFTGYPASSNGVVGDGLDGFDIFSQPNVAKAANNGTSPTREFVDISDDKPSYSTYSKHEAEVDSDGSSSPRKKEQVQEEDYIPAGDFGTADYSDVASRGLNESWITIDDVKLLTVPTTMPPPSRPPPAMGYRKKESYVFEDASDNFYVDDEAAAMQRQKEKEVQMVKEQEERERLEREAEERERQRRGKERELVERANREARERAARQARERAERVAVEKALQETRMRQAAEAKQRAEESKQKAEAEAKQRMEAEARQRAEAEAKEAEAKQRAEAEAQKRADAERRAQRAAVERVNAEARERAQRGAREQFQQQQQQRQQQQQQQQQQQRPADDLDSFFASRANSAPRQRPPTSDFPKPPERGGSGGAAVKKVSSVSSIDELSNLFDNSDSSFREIDGETAERRRARMERDHRTQARARQALEEKHRRDLAVQREQAEKDRARDTVDHEIKRWAAGKEGNIRALLSSLQYVLWPEAGWQAVSLTDVITGMSVKKVYRKATLCVHPDKVQQKGATIQQKYIAEKVFDLLQEAWKKFSSEELIY